MVIPKGSCSSSLPLKTNFECVYFKEPLTPDDDLELSSEDEAVASDLDMHALILGGMHQDTEPLKTAEEVIQEIDDMMQEESTSMERSSDSRGSMVDANETLEKAKEVLSSPLYEDSKYLYGYVLFFTKDERGYEKNCFSKDVTYFDTTKNKV